MKKLQTRIALLTGAVALALGSVGSSFAQSGQHGQHGQHGAAGASASQQGNMSHQEMMKTMQDMHQKMSTMSPTGDPDHDFAMMMRSHHQAGVDMAKAQLKNGKDPQMQQMAKKIVSDQTKEIKKLDQWMTKYHPAPK